MLKNFDMSDGFVFLGLPLIGTGLFFWFGLGVSLTVSGAVLLFLGVAANIAGSRKGG